MNLSPQNLEIQRLCKDKVGGVRRPTGCKKNLKFRKKKYFNGAHLLDLALNDEKSDDISLFGMKFKSNEEAKIVYSSILWFTYR